MSAAFLAHTLLLSGFPSPFQEPDDAHHRVSVELIAPGTVTRPERPTATALANNRNPRFEVSPLQTETKRSQSEPVAQTTSTMTSTPARAGEQAPLVEPQPVATATRITESPDEQDPYLVKLAVHLGHALEKLREPAITQLSERRAMEIELQLLNNGALTRARVLKSTGLKRIDDAAYRASLAASPYPEPPVGGQSRFEIELVFSPNRF
ncbi:TonB family protein [Marinobacter similis]|uniref:Energry transducer TonB n=1 Tax=Marinobacter similis TaxID=1420916 RepID=W5YIT0_9GAMM|nr:TonB family protein [Marinobacter similis]AHI28764.1 energry transducer TonB [Marinobacter similis]